MIALVGALAISAFGLSACAPERAVEIKTPPQVEAKLPAETLGALKDAVTNAMTATGSTGAIVGVWVPWSGTWVEGLGTASPTNDKPVTAAMTFRIGDVTREMTCDALYAAAADNLVKLDDSVTKYVSGVPDLKDVSLLELCNGTSTIGSYQAQLQPQWIANPDRVWNPRELASFGLGQTRTGEPGVAWRDSDAGYILLGLALSRATGKSPQEYLTDYIFEPLALESTRLPAGDGQWSSGVDALEGNLSVKDAKGVLNCAEPLSVTDVSASTGFTDSGVVSTIADLGRYSQALAVGALARDADATKARWAQPLAMGSASWFTTTGGAFQAGSLIGQYGSVPGYLTAAFADPTTGLTVAVVLNNSAAPAQLSGYLAWQLAAIASKAPAAAGHTAPEFGLPWTAEQYDTAIAKAAVCTPPPAP